MAGDPLSRYRDLEVIEVSTSTGSVRALPLRRQPSEAPRTARRQRYLPHEPLDLLARKEYGNEFLYWTIMELNGIDFPHEVEPGRQLFLAPLDQITRVTRR